MHILEIILDGFKSYAKRTVISGFDPEFNAITGLNGTGKSNILDSICFVLGISNLTQVRARARAVQRAGDCGRSPPCSHAARARQRCCGRKWRAQLWGGQGQLGAPAWPGSLRTHFSELSLRPANGQLAVARAHRSALRTCRSWSTSRARPGCRRPASR